MRCVVNLGVCWVLIPKKDIYASTSKPRKHSRRGSGSIVELRDGREHYYALSSEWNVTVQLETHSTNGYEDKTCTNKKTRVSVRTSWKEDDPCAWRRLQNDNGENMITIHCSHIWTCQKIRKKYMSCKGVLNIKSYSA